VFDPENIPYVQEFPAGNEGGLRILRIGIRNDSSAIIRNARVVIESVVYVVDNVLCPPTPEHPVPIEHALNVMGIGNKDGFFNLAPGDGPTAFVDVAEQRLYKKSPFEFFSFSYANRLRSELPLSIGPWLFTLRVEGGGTFAKRKFITGHDDAGKMVIRPYDLA
jgi:hypothetical protein